MSELIIRLYTKKSKCASPREGYTVLSGICSIICNVLLCAFKFTVGALSGCVSITADAVNNLSDTASNIVSIAGAKISNKPVDKEHPFGHGRVEYISALIVVFLIFLMGFELAKASVIKIIRPERVTFNIFYVIVLSAAILVKLWMAYFNSKLYKLTDNLTLKAVRQDSLNDCIATGASLIALILSSVLGIKRADGIIGLGVAIFVFISGADILKSILGNLLGQPPSKELSDKIEKIILQDDMVLGVHDLIVHNYGAGKLIASAHAEVPASADIVSVHNVIDSAERKIFEELGVDISIHMDPVNTEDKETKKYNEIVSQVIEKYNSAFSFHDLRLADIEGEKCLEFDVVIPFEEEKSNEQIKEDLLKIFSECCPEIKVLINAEHSYIKEKK